MRKSRKRVKSEKGKIRKNVKLGKSVKLEEKA